MNSHDLTRKGTLGIKWTEPEISIKGGTGNCVIVVPVYKKAEKLSKFEEKSIGNTVSVFGGKHEIVLLCGKSFDVDEYRKKFNHDFSFCKCSDAFFVSQKSYSDLCEKPEFYEAFSMYEYMLICQPDAWVFEDGIDRFVGMGYDYIGAIHMLRSNGEGGKVGNGGFSLRKSAKFAEVCRKTDFEKFRFTLLEDCAFSVRLKNEFNIAPPETGFEFGWQEQPQAAYRKTGKLPMGCHNPMRNNWNFWRTYIKISDVEFDVGGANAITGNDANFSVRPKYTRNVVIKRKPSKNIQWERR